MPLHEPEPRCLWLEFAGGAGELDLSNPFAFIRLIGRQIEGGEEHELIGWLHQGHWVLAADESIRFSRISGLGVFWVHLEQLDGSDQSFQCRQMHIAGLQLLVDGRAIARFDEARGVWTPQDGEARLHGIRLEPEASGATLLFEIVPQQAGAGSARASACA